MKLTGKTQAQLDAEKQAQEKETEIQESQNKLDATDWYAVRFAETGVLIPEEIKTERQALREKISQLRGEAT